MHGGVKVYRGAPAAARSYVEADRSRADDYYLAEGTGVAERLGVDPEGRVVALAPLSGEAYEAWVAGRDPDTGEPRGRLRTDGRAVRFVEVVVNGPKSWSLAAELHPDVAAGYEAAQDRAAQQIVGWLGRHATTRVGPRGAQVAVPVEGLDVAVIRHYTSRAGDPHRHLHLQVNARVFAAGAWRGLDTVAVRDSIQAVNGIGHAAVACDPQFRAALAAHGYTLTTEGEISQLAEVVGPFSKRTVQIGAHLDRYETAWRAGHPGQEPGPALRRAWDARAWAEDRPDKVIPRDGHELHARWLDELHALGYRDHDRPTQPAVTRAGALDRDAAAAEVIARLGAGRSAWNAADVRGQVEQLLARTGVLADAGVRSELAEDVTARALALCVPLHGDVPEHVRALTSQRVLDVEADLTTRLAARGAHDTRPAETVPAEGLDAGQRAAVAVLVGDARLVVIEGAAGAGKTTTLTAVRDALHAQGRRLLVVTPTRKAAQVARDETGAASGPAAWLAYQHGWRWDQTGTWTREPAAPPGEARLRPGDLLLVDEAGMLDQDTAHALLTIADETGARLALVGDRRQLPAVGRGGVLELACRWTSPETHVDLDTVHRFVQTVDGVTVPDEDYAALTLAMRTGEDPGAVFDALHARGQIALYASDDERTAALAGEVAAARRNGGEPVVVVDTREQATAVNAAVRDRLVANGAVDDTRTAGTGDGQPVGAGDSVVTRRNNTTLGVANREAWTVLRVHRDGGLSITARGRGERSLPAGYVREDVELGYATTSYGAQGDTTSTAHLVLTDTTTASSAYVGMTRGRHANTAHLVATDPDDAREQWTAAFGRDRADHGPEQARRAAEHAATGYTPTPAPASPDELATALDQLHAAWDQQARAARDLDLTGQDLAAARQLLDKWDRGQQVLAPLRERMNVAADSVARAEDAAVASSAALAATAREYRDQLVQRWYAERPAALHAAGVLAAGPGLLRLHRSRVAEARTQFDDWAGRWADVLADARVTPDQLCHPDDWHPIDHRVIETVRRWADARAAAEHPEHPALLVAAEAARADVATAHNVHYRAHQRLVVRESMPSHNPAGLVAEHVARLHAAQTRAARAGQQAAALASVPAITSQPDPGQLLHTARARWQAARDSERASALARARTERHQQTAHPHTPYRPPAPARHGPGIGI